MENNDVRLESKHKTEMLLLLDLEGCNSVSQKLTNSIQEDWF